MDLEVAEMKILRFAFGVTIMDKMTNDHIRGMAQVGRLRGEAERRKIKIVRSSKESGGRLYRKKMIEDEFTGRRARGTPKRWIVSAVKEDMREVGQRGEVATDRQNLRRLIRLGHPKWEKPKGKEENKEEAEEKGREEKREANRWHMWFSPDHAKLRTERPVLWKFNCLSPIHYIVFIYNSAFTRRS